MKPMLASDAVLPKIQFPVLAQPKIDGVRGLVINNRLVGRSLKQHRNAYVTELFSDDRFEGFDGELFFGTDPTIPDLCRNSTSVLSRAHGDPMITFAVFDWLREDVIDLPYQERLFKLEAYIRTLPVWAPVIGVPTQLIPSLEHLEALDATHLEQGYEGTIVRDQWGDHKQGRSTIREGGLLRIKRFVEEEALVIGLVQGNANGNEAKKNELGRTERSSHQANMIPNGQVGTLLCRDMTTGAEFDVSAGRMPHEQRKHFWEHQDEIIGQIIKYKHFPVGRKDKPRFPTFQTIRATSDMEPSHVG